VEQRLQLAPRAAVRAIAYERHPDRKHARWGAGLYVPTCIIKLAYD
jgi:hypothetical protein